MRALVTGASGFIGGHIARALAEAGFEVRALVRETSPRQNLEGLPVEAVGGDLTDPPSLERALSGCDALFHAAAHYSLWEKDPRVFYATNVDGTRAILEAARKANVGRVVYTSSVACVGLPHGGPPSDETREAADDDIVGDYKRSKVEAERVARAAAEAGQDVVVVNPSTPVGPGDVKPTPTGKIIVDFLCGRMPAFLDTGLNFVHVRDVAKGHLLALEKGVRGRRYILGHREGNLSLRDFLALVAAAAGRKPPRLRIPYAVAYLAGAASTFVADRITGRPPAVPLNGVRMARHRMFFDCSRAVSELGLPQTPVADAVREAVDWFRAKGFAPGAAA